MKDKYKDIIRNFVENLAKNRKVDAVYLFGSYLKNFGNLSDIDICIIGKLNNSEKKKILRESSEPFDISFFEELPVFIKARIFSEGEEKFVRNEEKIKYLKFDVLKDYRDFMFFMKDRIMEKFKNV